MRILEKIKKKKFILLLLPLVFVLQYYVFKLGIIEPMVKGIDINVISGDYVREIDKFTMKLGEEVVLSKGDYIIVPSYAKSPKIWFKVLDNDEVIKIEEDKVISQKEGIASVALMKDNRVLKKINIKVVDPKVLNLSVEISNDLNFVGDSASIKSDIEVDYDKFSEKEKVNYFSTDENVLKIEDNKIVAVGVGSASVLVDAGEKKESFDYKIKAKIKSINVKNIELVVGQSKNLGVSVETNPKNLKYDKVKYKLLGNENVISIDQNGNVVALKKGSQKVKIICQEESKIITVNVKNKLINEQKLKNLAVSYNKLGNTLRIYFSFDFIEDVFDYEIYINKNNTNFELLKSIKLDKQTKRINASCEIDLSDLKQISLYVVGKKDNQSSKISDIVDINFENNDEQTKEDINNKKIENVVCNVFENDLNVIWDSLDLEGVTYSIYIKDNLNNESGFSLYESNISENNFTISLNPDDYDFDFYVIGVKNGVYSVQSESVNVKKLN